MSRILPLPPDAVSQIHSSRNITSIQGVILALLENSLDAGSSKVEISIDFRRGDCTVEDNGQGIQPIEFAEHGGLCKQYHTSKRGQSVGRETHGTMGMYLSSLSALSLLTVTSRHKDYSHHATLSIHQGKVIARHDPAPTSHVLSGSSPHGTRVIVRDLFGNFPVRVKQRASLAESSFDENAAWNALRARVVSLLLAWPQPSSVRLQNVNTNGKHLQLFGAHPSISHAALTKKHLEQIAGGVASYTIEDALPILFQASVAPKESRGDWVPVSASASRLSLQGLICLSPAPSRNCQFLSIGVHPCSASDGHNELYDAINKVFSNSSFGVLDDDSDVDEAEKDRRKRDRRFKNDGFTRRQLHGRKGVDRWPMFVLKVEFNDCQEHNRVTEKLREGSMKAVVDILEATVTQWLVIHHFRPQKLRRKRYDATSGMRLSSKSSTSEIEGEPSLGDHDRSDIRAATAEGLMASTVIVSGRTDARPSLETGSTRPSSTPDPRMDFSSWSRIKSGQRNFYDKVWASNIAAKSTESGQNYEVERKQETLFNVPTVRKGELSKPGGAVPLLNSGPAISKGCTAHGMPASHGSDHEDDNVRIAQSSRGSVRSEPPRAAQPLEQSRLAENGNEDEACDDQAVQWVDPATGEMIWINARTGGTLPNHSKPIFETLSPEAKTTGASRGSIGKSLSLSRRSNDKQNISSIKRLPGFLKDWDNPTFALQKEEPIPVASGSMFECIDPARMRECKGPSSAALLVTAPSSVGKISKTMLQTAQVVKQVDRKFILCKSTSEAAGENNELLFLVDQHAASERVILEGLFTELCSADQNYEMSDGTLPSPVVKSVPLDRPVTFQISESEHELFQTHMQHFLQWGIHCKVSTNQSEIAPTQVRGPNRQCMLNVNALPSGIAERCTSSPPILIQLLRSELWVVAEAGKPRPPRPARVVEAQLSPSSVSPHQASKTRTSWVAQIASCPKGIIDLLNSRACRSAIMFNDELSNDECERLLRDLSNCSFPFICAHGRVSMVPILGMPGHPHSEVVGAAEQNHGASAEMASTARFSPDLEAHATQSFSTAFDRWRRRPTHCHDP